MKKIFWIISVALLIVACNSKDNFTITGTISNSRADWIYLEELGISGTVPFDSSKIDSKGNFELSGSVDYPKFFLLRLNEQKFITLLIDSLEEVSFSADYLNFASDYKIEGSLGSEKVQLLNTTLTNTHKNIDSLQSLLSLCVNDKDYTLHKERWIEEINKVYKDQEEFSVQFINDNPFSLASVLAIYQKFNNGNYVVQDLQTLKIAASALHSMYPKSVHAQTLYKDTEKLVKDIQQQKFTEYIKEYGQNCPEIALPDVNGKEAKLSTLKGKTVLIQFWSAKDRTSRIMNEVLAENYKKYKRKGFEIFQVSIDTDKSVWLQAIEEDQLNWTNVGDMEGSVGALNTFNIQSIPANYLIDGEGNILAKNIKGPEINKILNEILN